MLKSISTVRWSQMGRLCCLALSRMAVMVKIIFMVILYNIIMLRYKPYKKAYRQKLPLLLNRFFVIFTFEGASNCLMGKWEWL